MTELPRFSTLALRAEILDALAARGYETPTPIQAKAIPHLLEGRDLLGIAQTGTGKTAAFTLPMLQRLSAAGRRASPGSARALILTPTRELAIQIGDSIRAYGARLKLRHAVIFGGVGQNPQVAAVAGGLDILVATPGRLLDLMNQGHVRFETLEILVLDEADRMLDMGFIRDVKRIVQALPRDRQTLLFSATMPDEVASLAQQMLRDPGRVEVTPVATTAERIDQRVMFVDAPLKRALLANIMADDAMSRVIVFTRTKHGANRVAEHLTKAGIAAAAIHGNKSQSARQAALAGFRAGQVRALIATDIAARGIDVEGISHVVNFELPNVPESYVHRIGRTARAGADGIAISFCDAEERAYLRDIEKLTRKKLTVVETPAVTAPVEPERPRPPRPPQGRGARPAQGRGPRPAQPQGQNQNRNRGPNAQGGEHAATTRQGRQAGTGADRGAERSNAGFGELVRAFEGAASGDPRRRSGRNR